MPKIYEYFGIIFFFHGNDHTPIHVHASHGEFESKLEFVYKNGKLDDVLVKKVTGHKHLPTNVLKDAIRFVKAKENNITKKWTEFYGKNKKPEFEKITRKI